MTPRSQIDDARDAAQQAVTACVHGERPLGVDIIAGYPDHQVLALVLADLVAHVHHRWAATHGVNHLDAWKLLLADIEQWRTAR